MVQYSKLERAAHPVAKVRRRPEGPGSDLSDDYIRGKKFDVTALSVHGGNGTSDAAVRAYTGKVSAVFFAKNLQQTCRKGNGLDCVRRIHVESEIGGQL